MVTQHLKFMDRFRATRKARSLTVAAWFFLVSLMGATPLYAVDNLIYHNGPVFVFPDIYITYWGSAWQNGFTTNGIPSSQYPVYLEGFLNSICNSQWLLTQTQYTFAGCVPNRVVGTWIDPNNPPKITPDFADIFNEVKKSILHFQGAYPGDPNAVTIIALAPGFGDTAFAAKGGSACAWHDMGDYRAFIALPFQPDAPNACGQFSVNSSPGDGFGHGVFDGVSIVAAHELAEALTDPTVGGDKNVGGGWYGQSGTQAENGDKCAWTNTNNFLAGGNYYAVQPLWSNKDAGCVLGGAPAFDLSPASPDFSAVILLQSDTIKMTLTNTGNLDGKVWTNPYRVWGVSDYQDFQIGGNTCISGTVIPPGQSCQVDVTFRPTAVGLRQAQVELQMQNPSNQQIVTLSTTVSGTGIPEWAVALPPFFEDLLIGSSSSSNKAVALTNTSSDTPQYIQSVKLGPPNPSDFSIVEDGCSSSFLGPSQSCQVYLSFHPTATGNRQAELEFQTMDVTGAPGETFGTPVFGTGLGPVAQLSTTDLSFGDATFNSEGVSTGGEIPVSGDVQQAITYTNIGQAPLQVNGVEVSGDFILADNGCALPLAPGESCQIQVQLMPTHYQYQSGTLMIHDNTSDSLHKVKLTGSVGAAMAGLVPDEIQFGSVPVGDTSSPQTVTLDNLEGEASLHIQSIAATGDFMVASTDCPTDLIIGKCPITVTFKPTVAGPRNGMLVITDNAPDSPQQIPLTGSGASPGTDLIMTSVAPNAASVNAGAALSVTDTVNNAGLTSSRAFRIGYHLSTDTIYGNADDVVVSTIRVVTSLAAGASNSATTHLSIPSSAPGGTYYLCAMADSVNQVAESDETNNTLCSSTQVTVPPPDLILRAISLVGTTTVNKGAAISISFTINNQGGSKAVTFATGFHLSPDTIFGNGDDIPINKTLSLPSLGVGASYSNGSFKLVVPSTTLSGTYHVCGMTDVNNTVAESNEGNNTLCTGAMITVR